MIGLTLNNSYSIEGTYRSEVNGQRLTGRTNFSVLNSFTFGTGTGQANEAYVNLELSIAPSTQTEIILEGGSILNPVNEIAEFATIKEIYIDFKPDTVDQASSVLVGNAGTSPWVGPFDDGTATVQIKQGGKLNLGGASAAGWAVSAGNRLGITNEDATNTAVLRVVLVGIKPA